MSAVTMSIKPRFILEDMPWHIKKQIAGHLNNYTDIMSLRQVNTNFLDIVKLPHHDCHHFRIILTGNNSIEVSYGDESEIYSATYTSHPYGCFARTERMYYVEKKFRDTEEKFLMGLNFVEAAERDILMLLANNNLTVKCLEVFVQYTDGSVDPEEFTYVKNTLLNSIQAALQYAGGNLKVKQAVIHYSGQEEDVLSILPFLDSETLKILSLKCNHLYTGPIEISRIMYLDQVNHLEQLDMFDLPEEKVMLGMWCNYPRSNMVLRYDQLEDFSILLEHFIDTPTFEKSILRTSYSENQLIVSLGDELVWEALEHCKYTSVPINGTNEVMLVFVSGNAISFERIEVADQEELQMDPQGLGELDNEFPVV